MYIEGEKRIHDKDTVDFFFNLVNFLKFEIKTAPYFDIQFQQTTCIKLNTY